MLKIGRKIKIGDYVELKSHNDILICDFSRLYLTIEDSVADVFDSNIIDDEMIYKFKTCKSVQRLCEILHLDVDLALRTDSSHIINIDRLFQYDYASRIFEVVDIIEKNLVLPRYILRDVYDNILLVNDVKKLIKYKEYNIDEVYYKKHFKRFKSDNTNFSDSYNDKYLSFMRKYKLYFISYIYN